MARLPRKIKAIHVVDGIGHSILVAGEMPDDPFALMAL
jgi:hypothetical protein